MSYILEALKKAQAERQIGSAPTIHAPTLANAPAGQGSAGRRTPLIVAMVLMGAAIAGLATMLVRQQQAPSQAPAAVPAPGAGASPAALPPAPAAAASPSPSLARPPAPTLVSSSTASPSLVAVQPNTATGQLARASAPQAAAVPPTPQPAAPKPAAAPAAEPARTVEPPQKAATSRQGEAAAYGANVAPAAPTSAPAPTPAPAPAPVEEYVQSLHELPEPIQRAIPPIALGGYMYSKNPADRLLLIDKVLRREGEEVAPGLVLHKLLPKQAIFSFRGYRYRVPL